MNEKLNGIKDADLRSFVTVFLYLVFVGFIV